jgi:hypothetical protein
MGFAGRCFGTASVESSSQPTGSVPLPCGRGSEQLRRGLRASEAEVQSRLRMNGCSRYASARFRFSMASSISAVFL